MQTKETKNNKLKGFKIYERRNNKMPNVRSKLKDALDEELKIASQCLAMNPSDHIALKFVNAIHHLIDVCEERNRY